MSIRSAASVCQLLHEMVEPRGARMMRDGSLRVKVMSSSSPAQQMAVRTICHASRGRRRAPRAVTVERRVELHQIDGTDFAVARIAADERLDRFERHPATRPGR